MQFLDYDWPFRGFCPKAGVNLVWLKEQSSVKGTVLCEGCQMAVQELKAEVAKKDVQVRPFSSLLKFLFFFLVPVSWAVGDGEGVLS